MNLHVQPYRNRFVWPSLISVKAKENVLGKDILLFSNPNDTKKPS